MDWTLKDIADRILDETLRVMGEDVRGRRQAIVLTWLETVERQERQRWIAKAIYKIPGVPGGRLACAWCGQWETGPLEKKMPICHDDDCFITQAMKA